MSSTIPSRRAVLAGLALLPALRPRPAAAGKSIDLRGDFIQGGLVFGAVPTGTRIMLDGETVRVDSDGRFLLGFGRDAAPRAVLEAALPDGRREAKQLGIEQRAYQVQRIDGLPEDKVEPSARDLERIAIERDRIAKAKLHRGAGRAYEKGFIWPATGPISGVYGSQRILNGEPRQPHFGVDVAAPEGTELQAPAGGIVTLADADLFFTGGTVMLAHGGGLSSIFAHMQAVDVKEGQRLDRGDVFGRLGGTGRATGPHLHWGMYLLTTPLDPQLLAPPMPA